MSFYTSKTDSWLVPIFSQILPSTKSNAIGRYDLSIKESGLFDFRKMSNEEGATLCEKIPVATHCKIAVNTRGITMFVRFRIKKVGLHLR